ncbi:hypothetical protein VSS37_02985 [Candidatus Thiothrix sp. Deng01]|uniref:Uncharacterized protein n=1 Tax=Candidatus Thiothrix phosphatis TaxID=3112415 RepID=A0ABU6CSZ7_9GAMM|nr:hypothetical protein [Candidatus Thiothrix sp. Deng01]MEB4589933.1 hypothetical protein [Candidatus Thiothrix sp. Deng01]
MNRHLGMGLCLVFLWLAGCGDDKPKSVTLPVADKFTDTSALAQPVAREDLQAKIPELAAYWEKVRQALQADPPVLLLDGHELPDPQAQSAQKLAVAHPEFLKFTRDPKTGEALRNEIMTVRKALPVDFNGNAGPCAQAECWRVEMYSHFDNASTIAFVDVKGERVLGVSRQNYAQPDLPQHLVDLAAKIAGAAPEIQAILQDRDRQPDKKEFKTALQDSMCERSHHLCVAPTYVFANDALWAIVDLTDGKLVGSRWTDLGSSGPRTVVTERSLENETTFRNYCEKVNSLAQAGWSMDYVITGSDGLQLTNVKFNGRPVLKNAKLLDWHVSYSSREGFGYSDAIGCPLFSSAVVIAYDGPKTEPIVKDGQEVGFALVQDFRQPPWPTPCNYRYVQRFEFYRDGRFRVAQADFGRGCGTDGMYRPVVRIDLDVGGAGAADSVAEWDGAGWKNWDKEQWRLQDDAKLTAEGYQYRVTGQDGGGFYVEPGNGQFGDQGRGDHAFTYFSAYKPEEGEQDTVTLGSCCNKDYRQGPEHFIEPAEPLQGKDVVLWYVPQIKNDGDPGSEYCWADTRVKDGVQNIEVWPCWSGPMFVPVKAGG